MQDFVLKKLFTALTLSSILFLCACSTTQPATGETSSTRKILSYNIWDGFAGGKEEQTRFVNWMATQNLDVAALQELVGISEADLKKLAKKWGHSYVALVQENGIGLTSKYPIQNVRSAQDGYLYAETGGMGFYVVSFATDEIQQRIASAEKLLTNLKNSTLPNYYMVLGDFNSYSPQDSATYAQRYRYLSESAQAEQIQKRLESYTKTETYQPMRLFEQAGLKDVIGLAHRYGGATATYPTEVFGPMSENNRHRVDYLLANAALLSHLKRAEVIRSKETDYLSDHYPLVVTLEGL